MEMLIYTLKRIGVSIMTLLLVAAITFFLMNAIPGSPFMTEKSTPEQIALANAKYGLDKPLPIQFVNYLKNLAHGDMGVSLKMQEGTSVAKILFTQGKFTLSIKLGLLALLVAVIIGVPVGVLQAYYRGGWSDNFLRVVTTLGIAMPSFVVATLMLFQFAVKLKIFPVQSNSLETTSSYIMPVITLAIYPTCHLARLTRASILEVMNQDYLRTERAKVMSEYVVVFIHALKNSLIPVITYVAPLTASILTGGFVAESVFNVPGLGRYFVSCISSRDYTMIMGVTIFYSTLIIIMNLICDILYKIVDPRITLD